MTGKTYLIQVKIDCTNTLLFRNNLAILNRKERENMKWTLRILYKEG
jgi:hypothetical protein